MGKLFFSTFLMTATIAACKHEISEVDSGELKAGALRTVKYSCQNSSPMNDDGEKFELAKQYLSQHPILVVYSIPGGAAIDVDGKRACKYEGDAQNVASADSSCKGFFDSSKIRLGSGFFAKTPTATSTVSLESLFGKYSDVNSWLKCKLVK